MHILNLSRRNVVGLTSLTCSLIFAGVLGLSSIPAGAQTAPASTVCPVLSVGNPNPGDDLIPGGYVISGTAYDPAATTGSGISRVDLFLGQREDGGTILGSAVPVTVPGGSRGAFQVQVQVPNINRGVDFAAYALSSVTGQQTAVTFSVFVGVPPAKNPAATPTPIPTVTTVTTSCSAAQPGAVAVSAPAAPAVPVPAAPAPAAPAAPAPAAPALTGCPVLSVGNPNPADNVNPGGYVMSGIAYDPAATTGSGILRVDLFLGERDNGGTILGSAIPGSIVGGNPRAFQTEFQVPALNRGVNFAAYALSAITGQETAVVFPIFVGVPPTRSSGPTPTPIPTTSTVTTTCGSHR